MAEVRKAETTIERDFLVEAWTHAGFYGRFYGQMTNVTPDGADELAHGGISSEGSTANQLLNLFPSRCTGRSLQD